LCRVKFLIAFLIAMEEQLRALKTALTYATNCIEKMHISF
jgi:hypothetical protein